MGGGSTRSTRLSARKSKTGSSSKRKLEAEIGDAEPFQEGGRSEVGAASNANTPLETTLEAEEGKGAYEARTERAPTSRRKRRIAPKEDAESATVERPPTKQHDFVDDSLPQTDYSDVTPSGVKRQREKLVDSLEVPSLKSATPIASTTECESLYFSPDRSHMSEKSSNNMSQSLMAPDAFTSSKLSSPFQDDRKSNGPVLSTSNEQLHRQSDNEHRRYPSSSSLVENSDHDVPSSHVYNKISNGNQFIGEAAVIKDYAAKLTNQTPMESAAEIAVVTSTESCRKTNQDHSESHDISTSQKSQPLHTCIDTRVVLEPGYSMNLSPTSENANDLELLNLQSNESMQVGQGGVTLQGTLNLQSNDGKNEKIVHDTLVGCVSPTRGGAITTAEVGGVHDERRANKPCDMHEVERTIDNASFGLAHQSKSLSNSKVNKTDAEKSTDEVPLSNVAKATMSDANRDDVEAKVTCDSVFSPTDDLTKSKNTEFLKDTEVEVQYNEDPSVESYSILMSDNSYKSFAIDAIGAANGSETNLSVPRQGDVSLKLRMLSSFSVGERSQKVLGSECNEENLPELEAKSNIIEKDIANTLVDESTADPNNMSREEDKGMLPTRNDTFLSKDVHDHQTKQLRVEPEFFPHPNRLINRSPESGNDSKAADEVHFKFPQTSPHTQSPSVSQIKMALFLESTRVHRGVGAGRHFANYWECLERYITLNSHASEMNRSHHELDATLNIFLKTKKLKRLHNKLVLALMSEAMRDQVSAHPVFRHVPEKWKAKTIIHDPSRKSSSGQEKSESDLICMESDFQQWRSLLGSDSGAWTTYGTELVRSKLCTELKANISTSKTSQKDFAENEIIPAACIPASLQIDPLVRQCASNAGMLVSENAIWMIVVAAREYMTNVIKKTIANTRELEAGHLPKIPKSKMITLACQQIEAQHGPVCSGDGNNSGEPSNNKKGLISAAELAQMLALEPVIAGGLASSRMSWMRSAMSDGKDLGHCRLSQVNHVINSSIQQAGAKGDMKNVAAAIEVHDATPLPSIALQPRNTQDIGNTISQSSLHSNVASELKHAYDPSNEWPCQSSASLPGKSTSESYDAQHRLDPLSLQPYRPLAKAHFHVTAKPGPSPVNDKKCDEIDSKAIVSPPASDILIHSPTTRKTSEDSKQTTDRHSEVPGSLSISINGPGLATSVMGPLEKDASENGQTGEEASGPLSAGLNS